MSNLIGNVRGKMEDPYGTPVSVGCQVAYNYQGEVRLGTIVDIVYAKNPRAWNWVKIEVREQKSREISKVSKPKNLVVLVLP